MWTHVDRGQRGSKTWFFCGRHKWMAPISESTRNFLMIFVCFIPWYVPCTTKLITPFRRLGTFSCAASHINKKNEYKYSSRVWTAASFAPILTQPYYTLCHMLYYCIHEILWALVQNIWSLLSTYLCRREGAVLSDNSLHTGNQQLPLHRSTSSKLLTSNGDSELNSNYFSR